MNTVTYDELYYECHPVYCMKCNVLFTDAFDAEFAIQKMPFYTLCPLCREYPLLVFVPDGWVPEVL